MKFLSPLTIIFILVNCITPTSKWDIRGSWYQVTYGQRGLHDADRNYGEIFVTDSIIRVYDEILGTLPEQSYYIDEDSIYKCFGTEIDCEFIPMYKIKKIENDTLWMTVNPKWSKKPETYWVRLPKNELGYYDHTWTTGNSDSLQNAVLVDYQRRTFKYFMTVEEYDSAVKAGRWIWTMKDIKSEEELSKPTQRGKVK